MRSNDLLPHVVRMRERIANEAIDRQFGYAFELLLEAQAARAGR